MAFNSSLMSEMGWLSPSAAHVLQVYHQHYERETFTNRTHQRRAMNSEKDHTAAPPTLPMTRPLGWPACTYWVLLGASGLVVR